MAGNAAQLKIDIIADVTKATAGIESIDGTLGRLTKGLAGVGTAVAGAFAVGAVASFGVEAAKAADEAAKVSRATDAIVKATGQAAGVTSQQVADLAGSLSAMSGVDDELIQSGANILLTFKNVKRAGDGLDDVFGRANTAALDLAAAGFGDVEGNAKMLGKALNDPVAGLSALSRAGVTFTAQQEEQIRVLTASGDVLGAQKIILAEVEAQVGGTAAATASSMDKFSVAFGNAQEAIGAALLPLIDELLPVVIELIDELLPVVVPVVKVMAELAGTLMDALLPALEPLIPVILDLARSVGVELGRVIQALAPELPKLTGSFAKLLGALLPILPVAADLLIALMPIITPLVDMVALVADLASGILARLIPALRPLTRVFETIGEAIGTMVGWLKSAVEWIAKMIDKLSNPILKGIGGIVSGIGGIFGRAAPAAALTAGAAGVAAAGRRMATGPTARGAVIVNVQAGIILDPIAAGRQIVDVIGQYERLAGTRWRTA